jgi:hypothetical protein
MIGAVALVAVVWLLARASDEGARRAVAPVRDDAAPLAAEPAAESVPIQGRDSEPAPAAREIVSVVEPEPAKADDAALGANEALLIVDVTSADTGKPLGGVRLVLAPSSGSKPFRHVDSSRARPGENPVTDSNGRAEFVAIAGIEHSLIPNAPDFEREIVDVPALSAGERRRVELRLRSESDFLFHARVVDAETEAPLPDAVVRNETRNRRGRIGSGDPIPFGVGPDGRLRYPGKTREEEFLSATAPGHGIRVFRVGREHDTVARELVVPLARSATLECVVVDRGRPADDAKVRLQTDAYRLALREGIHDFFWGPDPEWNGSTDASGLARIPELPPGTELRVAVMTSSHGTRDEADSILLEPGEVRRMTIELAPCGAIAGRIVRSDGTPIPNANIWLVAEERQHLRFLQAHRKPTATSRADERGRFRFDAVPPGAWCVGAEPHSRYGRGRDPGEEIAPLAECVEIAGGEVQVEVRTDVGLYIEGRVIGPDGVTGVRTSVHAWEESVSAWTYEETDDDGRFRIGPLVSGAWQLTAGGLGSDYAQSEPRSIEAGAREVVLQVLEGGTIRGRVVSADGSVVNDAEIVSGRTDVERAGWSIGALKDGAFEFESLAAGTYSLAARTRDGQFGSIDGILVTAGSKREGLVITVEPAAMLTVRNPEDEIAQVRMKWRGACIGGDGLEGRHESSFVVPPGDLVLEIQWQGEDSARTQSVTIARGETKEIVLKRTP